MARKIQAPGIELNEIDYSSYETESNSLVDTTALIMGFTDKGMDYATRYVNNMNNYVKMFGVPTNEQETYLYNAANEIIAKGGNVYVAKLPYDNNVLNRYSYVEYNVGDELKILSTAYDIVSRNNNTQLSHEQIRYDEEFLYEDKSLSYLKETLDNVISVLSLDIKLDGGTTIGEVANAIVDIAHSDIVGFYDVNLDETAKISDLYDATVRILEFFPKTYEMSSDYNLVNFCFYPDFEIFVSLSTESKIPTYVNFLDFCNEFGVNLSFIEDFIKYITYTYNFDTKHQEFLDSIFYKNGTFRNESTYILSSLYTGEYDSLSNYGIYVLTDEEREKYNDITQKLKLLYSFDEIVLKYAKSYKVIDYSDYLANLNKQLNTIYEDVEDEQIYKSVEKYLQTYIYQQSSQSEYSGVKAADESLTSYIEITNGDYNQTGLMTMEYLDDLKVKKQKVEKNKIRIVDMTRSKYKSEFNATKDNPMEYLGLLPVITTASNAMYYQSIITNSALNFKEYNALSAVRNIRTQENTNVKYHHSGLNNDGSSNIGFTDSLGSEDMVDERQTTVSTTAASFFPNIQVVNGKLVRKHLKDIGVVVFKMEVDKSLDYKVAITPVESFVGSLNRLEIDEDTKQNRFIDNIVNDNSKYINLFSNVNFSTHNDTQLTNVDLASLFVIANQEATSLGFYSKDCKKQISLQDSIYNAIDRIFDNNIDINLRELDLVVDAGVSNIAQFIQSVYPHGNKGDFDLYGTNAFLFKLNSPQDTTAWSMVIDKYNKFCKNTRKDCMFIADGLRSLCLNGDEKVVRNTKPENTLNNTILKNIGYMSSKINSSYGAGYSDWFLTTNVYNGELFWCPPSIKASGIYIYTDVYSYYWMAPAGLNRGKLDDSVVDVAFSPNMDQAGYIYNNCWNYCVNYPIDGIVLEGQKTFQRDKTAFDRVNVRRLFLGLEKQVRYIAKYFKYDQITDYMMTRFVDSITPIFENAKNRGGLKEYVILCDRNNNTNQTIDNNELHCTIGVKPIKSAEFIVLNYICTNQSVNVEEVVGNYVG